MLNASFVNFDFCILMQCFWNQNPRTVLFAYPTVQPSPLFPTIPVPDFTHWSCLGATAHVCVYSVLFSASYFWTWSIRLSLSLQIVIRQENYYSVCSVTVNFALFTMCCIQRGGTERRKRRANCCPPWWLLFLCVFIGLALAQWSTAFKWATRECLNGEAGGVCLWRGVGVRQQECVVMPGLFSLIRWAQLGPCTLALKLHCGL